MSSLSQLSLSNTERVIADSIHLIIGNELKNIFDVFLTQSDASTIVGLDPATIIILQDIANSIPNNSNWYQDILNELSLRAYISQTYSRTYIDNLIANYYLKSELDTLLNNKLNSSE